jgi:hypothetical protein
MSSYQKSMDILAKCKANLETALDKINNANAKVKEAVEKIRERKYLNVTRVSDSVGSLGAKMSQLIDFYFGKSTDTRKRNLSFILKQNDLWLEQTHDYIQWLFPLQERSENVPDSPMLTKEDIDIFSNSSYLQNKILASFSRMLDFYYLKIVDGKIEQSETDQRLIRAWLNKSNHNFLRITRILKCLNMLGLKTQAQMFFSFLSKLYNKYPTLITAKTFLYWKESIQ